MASNTQYYVDGVDLSVPDVFSPSCNHGVLCHTLAWVLDMYPFERGATLFDSLRVVDSNPMGAPPFNESDFECYWMDCPLSHPVSNPSDSVAPCTLRLRNSDRQAEVRMAHPSPSSSRPGASHDMPPESSKPLTNETSGRAGTMTLAPFGSTSSSRSLLSRAIPDLPFPSREVWGPPTHHPAVGDSGTNKAQTVLSRCSPPPPRRAPTVATRSRLSTPPNTPRKRPKRLPSSSVESMAHEGRNKVDVTQRDDRAPSPLPLPQASQTAHVPSGSSTDAVKGFSADPCSAGHQTAPQLLEDHEQAQVQVRNPPDRRVGQKSKRRDDEDDTAQLPQRTKASRVDEGPDITLFPLQPRPQYRPRHLLGLNRYIRRI